MYNVYAAFLYGSYVKVISIYETHDDDAKEIFVC